MAIGLYLRISFLLDSTLHCNTSALYRCSMVVETVKTAGGTNMAGVDVMDSNVSHSWLHCCFGSFDWLM